MNNNSQLRYIALAYKFLLFLLAGAWVLIYLTNKFSTHKYIIAETDFIALIICIIYSLILFPTKKEIEFDNRYGNNSTPKLEWLSIRLVITIAPWILNYAVKLIFQLWANEIHAKPHELFQVFISSVNNYILFSWVFPIIIQRFDIRFFNKDDWSEGNLIEMKKTMPRIGMLLGLVSFIYGCIGSSNSETFSIMNAAFMEVIFSLLNVGIFSYLFWAICKKYDHKLYALLGITFFTSLIEQLNHFDNLGIADDYKLAFIISILTCFLAIYNIFRSEQIAKMYPINYFYHGLIEKSNDGFAALDETGKIIFENQVYQGQGKGNFLSDVSSMEDEVQKYFQECLDSGKSEYLSKLKVRVKTAESEKIETRYYKTTLYKVEANDGKIYVYLIDNDYTEITNDIINFTHNAQRMTKETRGELRKYKESKDPNISEIWNKSNYYMLYVNSLTETFLEHFSYKKGIEEKISVFKRCMKVKEDFQQILDWKKISFEINPDAKADHQIQIRERGLDAILTNAIFNSMKAIENRDVNTKQILVLGELLDSKQYQIKILDNGIGVLQGLEYLNNILKSNTVEQKGFGLKLIDGFVRDNKGIWNFSYEMRNNNKYTCLNIWFNL